MEQERQQQEERQQERRVERMLEQRRLNPVDLAIYEQSLGEEQRKRLFETTVAQVVAQIRTCFGAMLSRVGIRFRLEESNGEFMFERHMYEVMRLVRQSEMGLKKVIERQEVELDYGFEEEEYTRDLSAEQKRAWRVHKLWVERMAKRYLVDIFMRWTGGEEVEGREVLVYRMEGVESKVREELARPADERRFMCGKCGARGVNMKKCARCKKVCYCGVECQREDWKEHKGVCGKE